MLQLAVSRRQLQCVTEMSEDVSNRSEKTVWCGMHGWQRAWMGVCPKCMANYCKEGSDERTQGQR